MEVERLEVWQLGIALAKEVYAVTSKYPKEELFGLTNQTRRAAVSVPSNIAEGKGRGTAKDFINFLNIARGSLYELKTQIRLGKEFGYIENNMHDELSAKIDTLIYKLKGLILSVRNGNRESA